MKRGQLQSQAGKVGLKVEDWIDFRPSFFILMFLMIALGDTGQFLILLLAVTLHEGAHMLLAWRWGHKTVKITVSALGLMALIPQLYLLPKAKRYAVFWAGPVCNLLLAGIGAVFGWPGAWVAVNLALCVFNLLPIYPLDGGRLLQSIAGNRMGILPANRVTALTGRVTAAAVAALGLVQLVLFPYNGSLFLLGVYLFKKTREESIQMTCEFLLYITTRRLYEKKAGHMPVKLYPLNRGMPVKTAAALLRWDDYVILADFNECVKITMDELGRYIEREGFTGDLGQALELGEK